MEHIRNGMPAGDLGREGWHEQWSGTNRGACVELNATRREVNGPS